MYLLNEIKQILYKKINRKFTTEQRIFVLNNMSQLTYEPPCTLIR